MKLSQIDFRTYDPTGEIVRWALLSAERKRRTETKPYGQRPKTPKITELADAEPHQKVSQSDPESIVVEDEAWESDEDNLGIWCLNNKRF